MSEIKITPRDIVRDVSNNNNEINKNTSYYEIKYKPSESRSDSGRHFYRLQAIVDWEHGKFEITDDLSRGYTNVEEMSVPAVKPCPCCGSNAHIKAECYPEFKIWCECDKCHLHTQPRYPATDNRDNVLRNIERCKATVLKQWNERV